MVIFSNVFRQNYDQRLHFRPSSDTGFEKNWRHFWTIAFGEKGEKNQESSNNGFVIVSENPKSNYSMNQRKKKLLKPAPHLLQNKSFSPQLFCAQNRFSILSLLFFHLRDLYEKKEKKFILYSHRSEEAAQKLCIKMFSFFAIFCRLAFNSQIVYRHWNKIEKSWGSGASTKVRRYFPFSNSTSLFPNKFRKAAKLSKVFRGQTSSV